MNRGKNELKTEIKQKHESKNCGTVSKDLTPGQRSLVFLEYLFFPSDMIVEMHVIHMNT